MPFFPDDIDLWPWHSNSSERGTKHVFPVNLAQFRSAIPEIFNRVHKQSHWQRHNTTSPYTVHCVRYKDGENIFTSRIVFTIFCDKVLVIAWVHCLSPKKWGREHPTYSAVRRHHGSAPCCTCSLHSTVLQPQLWPAIRCSKYVVDRLLQHRSSTLNIYIRYRSKFPSSSNFAESLQTILSDLRVCCHADFL